MLVFSNIEVHLIKGSASFHILAILAYLTVFYLVAFSDSALLRLMLYSFINNSHRVRKEYISFCINQLITDKSGRQLVEKFGAFLILYSCMYIIKSQI